MVKVRRIGNFDKEFVVYGTRINNFGDTEFFIHEDGYWFWEVVDGFIPVID